MFFDYPSGLDYSTLSFIKDLYDYNIHPVSINYFYNKSISIQNNDIKVLSATLLEGYVNTYIFNNGNFEDEFGFSINYNSFDDQSIFNFIEEYNSLTNGTFYN